MIRHHDAIEIADMEKIFSRFVIDRNRAYLKFLEEAEAKGKFQRLSSLDDAGLGQADMEDEEDTAICD